MQLVGFLCALLLALVLVWAAAAKLARPAVTTASFRALGLPLPGALAWGVPALELVVATFLVAIPPAGAAAAVVILVVFSAVLARALRAGTTTSCSCFGSARTDPITPADLVRNALLIGLAVVAIATA
jgi:uncharacterized membrane protein YphA (DoxX/SURF4 family)